jgi:uncharacterized membrane protein
VIAIIITIMVLELKAPHAATWASLRPVLPVFLSYMLSYAYVGIYWNNHHHLLAATTRVRGAALWANLHLLFWLSLIPFGTAWLGSAHFAAIPTALYGIILLGACMAYAILQYTLIKTPGQNPVLATAMQHDAKGKACPPLYALAIALAFFIRGLPKRFISASRCFGSFPIIELSARFSNPKTLRITKSERMSLEPQGSRNKSMGERRCVLP